MNWMPLMTFLAAAAGTAGAGYLAWVAWICIRDAMTDGRARHRRVAR